MSPDTKITSSCIEVVRIRNIDSVDQEPNKLTGKGEYRTELRYRT